MLEKISQEVEVMKPHIPDLTDEYIQENSGSQPSRHRMTLFAHTWLANGQNGTAAAIQAGYSPRTAGSIACELLRKVFVQRIIQNVLGADPYKIEEARRGVVQHLLAVRDAHLGSYLIFDDRGQPHFDLISLTREQSAAIESLKIKPSGEVEVRLKDSVRAAELLGKALNMFVDRHEFLGENGQPLVPPIINVMFVDRPQREEE